MEGKTPVPEKENLRDLAKHQATLAIFLSIPHIEEVVAELLEGGYSASTPAAVVYKASWPSEKVIRATLQDIAGKVQELDTNRQALILVGNNLEIMPGKDHRSILYRKR